MSISGTSFRIESLSEKFGDEGANYLMEMGHFFRREELIKRLDGCLGKTLGEVDKNRVFDKTKIHPKITGIAGDVIEQSVLEYPADNKQEPDLNIEGVKTELKTTGIKMAAKNKKRYEAKEPMSITAVSPDKIVSEEFKDSKFWHKLEHLLFVYYLYDSNKTVKAADYANFLIKGYHFYEFNDSDQEILQNDWMLVRDFLRDVQKCYPDPQSQYSRLSSELRKQLMYIDTAPKWPNSPRFRLKRTVVTRIVQEHFGHKLEQLPGKYTSYQSIDEKCMSLQKKYARKSILELGKLYNIEGNLKQKAIGEKITVKMFDGKAKKMGKIALFNEIGLIGKTVRLTTAGLRTEDMKLFPIDFEEIMNKEISFEESSFREYFANHQLLCIIFEEPDKKLMKKLEEELDKEEAEKAILDQTYFVGFKRLAFDDEFIEQHVKSIWDRIRYLIEHKELKDIVEFDAKTGKAKRNKKGHVISAPNFPKASEGLVFVRGTGKNSDYKNKEINGIKMYSQSIWIKGSYIASRLSEIEF